MSAQCFCIVCVDSADRGVLQNCGKFASIAQPGCAFVSWPFTTMSSVTMKTRQENVVTNTKTKDNVTVQVTTAIMYKVGADDEDIESYYFKLSEPKRQIEAYVDDCIRSQLPSMTLDEAFEAKEAMAERVKTQVASSMKQFGIVVVQALMTDMQPDATVMAAMNRIQAERRNREAAMEKAEAEKIIAVKNAEAEAEAKHLSGMGTAKMRQAITDGFKGSIESMKSTCGMNPQEVVHMMLVTQYLDVLKNFAESGKATMVVPHGPSAIQDIEQQVRNGFMQASMMPGGDLPR